MSNFQKVCVGVFKVDEALKSALTFCKRKCDKCSQSLRKYTSCCKSARIKFAKIETREIMRKYAKVCNKL